MSQKAFSNAFQHGPPPFTDFPPPLFHRHPRPEPEGPECFTALPKIDPHVSFRSQALPRSPIRPPPPRPAAEMGEPGRQTLRVSDSVPGEEQASWEAPTSSVPLYLQPPPAARTSRFHLSGLRLPRRAHLRAAPGRGGLVLERLGPAAVQPAGPLSPPPGPAPLQSPSPGPAPASPARPLAPRRARHSRAGTNRPRSAGSDPAPPSRRASANQERAWPGQPKPLQAEPMAGEDRRSRPGGRGAGRLRLGRGLKAAGAGPGCGESL